METKQCSVCLTVMNTSFFQSEGSKTRNQCKSCRLKKIHDRLEKIKNSSKIIPENKVCKNCKERKCSNEFNKSSISSDSLAQICRVCLKVTRSKKSFVEITSSKMLDCRMCKLSKSSSEFKTNKKALTGFYSICNSCWKPPQWNKEKQKNSERKYIKNNPDKIKAKHLVQANKPHRIIKQRLGARIKCALKSVSSYKNNKTVNYLGCNILYFKKWIEYQFTDGMNWDNRKEWHIDHVKPCASFNLLDHEQQKLCFNWTNMRPCWKKENLEKSDKIDTELISKQEECVKRFLEVNPLPT